MNKQDIPNRIKLDKKEDCYISTIKPSFMALYGNYETAICLIELDKWKIVRAYNTLDEALKGHNEIINMSIEELSRLEQIKER